MIVVYYYLVWFDDNCASILSDAPSFIDHVHSEKEKYKQRQIKEIINKRKGTNQINKEG
jgi:hypothetical protein